jgi:hypothetical protein
MLVPLGRQGAAIVMGYSMQHLTSAFVIHALLVLGHAQADQPEPSASPIPALKELTVLAPRVVIEPPIRIRGKDFSWEHEIQIALPASYGTQHKSYPVLWMTDGLTNFELGVQVVHGAWRKYLPEMIVVAVGPPAEAAAEFQARRVYEFTLDKEFLFHGIGSDLAKRTLEDLGGEAKAAGFGMGGAPKFLEFLVDELRSTLAKKYRMSGTHTLFGASGGGFFCTYAFLARPKSFDKYICLSPSLYMNEYELFRLEENHAKANRDLPAAVFLAAGEGEVLQGGFISGVGIVSSMSRMAEILKLRNYPSLELHVRIFPGEEHGSYRQAGLSHGLRTLWESEERSR